VPLRTESDAREGDPVIEIDGKIYQVSILENRQAITASDRVGAFASSFTQDDVFGVFKDSYTPHPYAEWLVANPATLLSAGLQISSAGLLRNRAQAFVELSVPGNKDVNGFKFRPNLLANTSLDGTALTSYSRTITAVVCDNTRDAALQEKGPKVGIRHSKHSALRVGEAQRALELVETLAEEFIETSNRLMNTPISEAQWNRFVELHFPGNATTAEHTHALAVLDKKRDLLLGLYESDPRVQPWAGTAFGVLQAVNTQETHYTGSRSNKGLAERQVERTVKGEFSAVDARAWEELTAVLEGRDRELLAA
jgi:phage/plasmid-like protein (TIGR03299 family)